MMIRNFIWQLARYIINKRYKRMGFIMHPTSVISAHYIKKNGGGVTFYTMPFKRATQPHFYYRPTKTRKAKKQP